MASKKTKSSKSTKLSTKSQAQGKSKKELICPDAWLNELAGMSINEGNWKCSLAMVEEQSVEATVYVEHFNEAAAKGDRLAVRAISRLEVMNTVIRNKPDNNPGKEVTPLAFLCSKIFEAVGPEFQKKIPTHLLAPLIKYIILDYKATNKRIREGIRLLEKEFDEYQESLWKTSKGKSPSGRETESIKKDAKSTNKENIGKGQKEKAYTKLRRRGEEWKDVSWVDDSPLDGPQLYVALSTFFDADLPLELITLNVPLNAIICLGLIQTRYATMPLPTDLNNIFKSLSKFGRHSAPYLSSNIRKSYYNNDVTLKNDRTKIAMFWDNLTTITHQVPTSILFKDIMFWDFIPQHSNFKHEIIPFQKEIYQQMSHFLYDLFETTKKHKEYIKEIKLLDVLDQEICDLSNHNLYNSLLNSVPHESINIPFILDAIVTQVCNLEHAAPEEQTPHHISNMSLNGTDTNLLKLLGYLNLKFDLHQDCSMLEANNINCDPKMLKINSKTIQNVITYYDEINLKTFHLDISIAGLVSKRTNHILRTAWSQFFRRHSKEINNEDRLVKLCNEIIKLKEQTGQHELYYYVYLLIINSLLNPMLLCSDVEPAVQVFSTKQSVVSYNNKELCEDCKIAIIHSSPSNDFMIRNNNGSNNGSNSHASFYTCNSGDDLVASNLFYIEDMISEILLQKIQNIFSFFNYFEVRLCPFEDRFILLLHNIPSSDRFELRENWMGKLTTHVPIRDFVDYILDEEEYWLYNNDVESNLDFNKLSVPLSFMSLKDIKCMHLLTFPDSVFISNKSIKYELLMKRKISEKHTSETSQKIKESLKENITGKNKPKGEKDKNKKKPSQTVKDLQETIHEPIKKDYTFKGYDLGEPMRFQYNGCKQDKILDDKCRITLNKMNKLYGEERNAVDLNVNDHHLYYEYQTYTGLPRPSPFHVILSSGIILYFGCSGRNLSAPSLLYNVDQQKPVQRNIDSFSQLKNKTSYDGKREIEHKRSWSFGSSDICPRQIQTCDYLAIQPMYDLKMSTPSGQHVEIANDCEFLYIRQTLLSKGPSCKNVILEKRRCFLSSGHVIKFLLNEEIEVLGANGTIYTIREKEEEQHIEITSHQDIDLRPSLLSVREQSGNKSKDKTDYTNNKKAIDEKQNKISSDKVNKPKKILGVKTSHKEIDELSVLTSNLKLKDYNLTTSCGKRYSVQNTKINAVDELYMSSFIDIENNCINSIRHDGLTTKHLPDGSLVVTFTDGTRITSSAYYSGEIWCKWTTEEFDRWFTSSTDTQCSSTTNTNVSDDISDQNKTEQNATESVSQQEMLSRSLHSDSQTSAVPLEWSKLDFSDDGFTVISLNYFIEHPNYISVHFNLQSCELEFKLPFSTSITLKNDGSYSASFDGASLTVDDDEIYFNRTNDKHEVIRTTVINNTGPTEKTIVYLTEMNEENPLLEESFFDTVDGFCFKSIVKDMNMSSKEYKKIVCVLLYSVDLNGNELYVDFDLQIHDPCQVTVKEIKGIDFMCFVLERDLNGFSFVSDAEVKEYTDGIIRQKGLVRNYSNVLKSIFTSSAVLQNESERWLMNNKKMNNSNDAILVSTYSDNKSWFQPFVKLKADTICNDTLIMHNTVVVRLLHRIPAECNLLNTLRDALEKFKKLSIHSKPERISYNDIKCDLNLVEITHDTHLLEKVYEEEKFKLVRENDKLRCNMKGDFLRSIIHQACIKAMKSRQNIKELEFKHALRYKYIPPYHQSCYGHVHNIIDQVLSNINDIRKSTSSTSVFNRINSIVDDILGVVLESETHTLSTAESSNSSKAVHGIVSSIFKNVWDVTEQKNYQNDINNILEKQLNTVTTEDVEFLCNLFEIKSNDCPILNNEEFILHDLMEARLQISHYFMNLRHMLESYRGLGQTNTQD